MTDSNWNPITLYCPHCASKLHMHMRKDDTAKTQCQRCGRDIILHREGRRHNQIDTYNT